MSRYDGQRGWFLPDDFLRFAEHPEEAARRIAKEQVGLEAVMVRLSHIESFGDGAWHMAFHYRADLKGTSRITPGANIAAAEWFALAHLPERASVSHHGWALETLAQMRKNRPR